MGGVIVETVDQKTDRDHLAVPERMSESEEGCCRHAPGDEIVARRNIDAERPTGRQQHHQHKNRNEEESGEVAGQKIESIKKHTYHNVSAPVACVLFGSNRRTTSGNRSVLEKAYQSQPAEGGSMKSAPKADSFSEL